MTDDTKDKPIVVPPSVKPDPTKRTTAFQLAVASWAVTILVTYLASKRIFVPDGVQSGLVSSIAEGINAAFPMVMAYISGVITKVVAELSRDKNVEQARSLGQIVQSQVGQPSTNIGKVEVRREREGE